MAIFQFVFIRPGLKPIIDLFEGGALPFNSAWNNVDSSGRVPRGIMNGKVLKNVSVHADATA